MYLLAQSSKLPKQCVVSTSDYNNIIVVKLTEKLRASGGPLATWRRVQWVVKNDT